MKAMILAAGLGTRLKPFTDEHPKALAVVNNKTLLQRNIEYLLSFNIRDIIVNVHHFPGHIRRYILDNQGFGANISFSDESDEVLETGGGLMKASWFLRESDPFLLMNVDVLTTLDLNEMITAHHKRKPVATIAVSSRNTSRYFLFDQSDRLCGWKNIRTGEQKISRKAEEYIPRAFSGIHVISPKLFDLIKQKGKFSMTEAYLHLAESFPIFGYDHTGTKFIDVGKPERIEEAEEMFT